MYSVLLGSSLAWRGRARSAAAVNLVVAADEVMVSAASRGVCRSTLGSKLGGGDGHWAEVFIEVNAPTSNTGA